MPRPRRFFPPEYKAEVVELIRTTGKTVGRRGDPGPPASARLRRPLRQVLPAAVACLLDTLPELTTFLRLPREHRARIRHTKLIQRTFGETRRRVKVIGRLPGERSCLSLVWAVLDRAARG
jgi:putative transposase